MSWCKELVSYLRDHHSGEEKMLAVLETLGELADIGYETNPSNWDNKRDLVESHVYGWHFTKECAEKAIAKMRNKDGGSGAYWTLEDVTKVAQTMNIDWSKKNYNLYDLYYTLNMIRSDYFKESQAPQYYVDLAFDFLEDKDAPEGKAKRYYYAMNCMN